MQDTIEASYRRQSEHGRELELPSRFSAPESVDGERVLDGFKQIVNKLLRGDTETRFEPCRNFTDRLDIRETAKRMTALGESHIAYRRFDDFYLPGLGRDRAEGWTRGHLTTRFGIAVQKILRGLGLLAWGPTRVLILKGEPSDDVIAPLRRRGFRIEALPVNTYAFDCGEASEQHGLKSIPDQVRTSGLCCLPPDEPSCRAQAT